MISIFNYTSYREFLHDYYKEKKSLNHGFSYQYLADQAGFKTKTFIYKVIKGHKALAKLSTLKIAKAMNLKKRETDYFDAMVNFNNAANSEEKEFYFHRLQSLSRNHKASIIRENQFSYFENWYYVVIRELVTILNWKEDYNCLAKAVKPRITPKQAEKAVKLLLELGMIKKLKSGKYIQTDKAITTGDQVISLAVKKFQRENMKLASESIDRYKKEIRDISSLTVGITKDGFERIKNEIKAFRETLSDIVDNDNPADRVYQINFQFFPVSEIPE